MKIKNIIMLAEARTKLDTLWVHIMEKSGEDFKAVRSVVASASTMLAEVLNDLAAEDEKNKATDCEPSKKMACPTPINKTPFDDLRKRILDNQPYTYVQCAATAVPEQPAVANKGKHKEE